MRRNLSFLVVALALSVNVVTAAAPAYAGVADLTCTPPSGNLNEYDPPLTLTPQPVALTLTAQYGPCVSPSQPTITSGARAVTVNITAGCLDLLGAASGSYTITWNTGQTSTVAVNTNRVIAGAAYTLASTGVVTSGVFAGDAVVANLTGPSTDITLCTLGLGSVDKIYTIGTLELTSL